MEVETHLLRVTLTVRKIFLTVRFPCSLSFQVKADQNNVENKNTYELKKGECIVNESIQIQTDCEYSLSRKKYQDKKISIIVFMNSPNGKIPAGTANIILTNQDHKSPNQHSLALEKCPDKSAQIILLQSIEFMRKRPTLAISNVGLGKYNQKYSSSSVTNLNQMKFTNRMQSPNINQEANDNVSRSKSKNSRFKSGLNKEENSQKSHHSIALAQSRQEEVSSQQAKILRLGREKANYIRQLAKLKGQLHEKHADQKQNEDNVILLTEQLEKAKEKIRVYERNEREMANNIRDLKQQIQKKKNKVQYSETQKIQIQSTVQQKDKIIKELEAVRKKLEDRLEDMNIETATLIKRLQVKQAGFKQQMKKMTQKYNLSESQRQKITHDMNNMLSQMQNSQRKNQINTKQKEKQYLQQKSKLSKKIQQLTKNVQSLEEEISDKDVQIKELSQTGKKIQVSEQQKIGQLTKVSQQLQRTLDKLRKQTQNRKSLEKDVELLKVCQEERNTYRKKYNETNQEYAKVKERMERMSSTCLQLQSKIQEQQDLIKQKSTEKAQAEHKLANINKQLQTHKKNQQRKYRQAQTLSVQNYTTGQKLSEIKVRLQSQKDRYTELQNQYHNQITYMLKQKDQLLAQIDEMKWLIQKNKDSIDQLNAKLKQASQQKLYINQENLSYVDKLSKAHEQINQLRGQNDRLISRIENYQTKQKQSSKIIKQKSDYIYEQQKKIQTLQQNIYDLKEKVKHYEVYYAQKLSTQETISKEKQMLALVKIQQITQLQLEIMNKNDSIYSKDQDIKIKSGQISHLKEQINTLKTSVGQQETTIEELRKQFQEANEHINKLSSSLGSKSEQHINLQKSYAKLKSQWDEYKIQIEKAMQQLVKEVGKDQQNSTKLNLLVFPDINLSMLQVQAIKKRNSIIAVYRQQVNNLEQVRKVQQAQIKKNKQYYDQQVSEYQAQIKKLKIQIQQFVTEISNEKQSHFSDVKLVEEKRTQCNTIIQKLTHQLQSAKDVIQQSNSQYQQLQKQKENLQLQLKNQGDQIIKIKAEAAKQKTMLENQINAINERNNAQQQKMKDLIAQQQKKISLQIKMISDKDQNIRKLQNTLSNLNYQKDKLNQNVIDCTSKINNLQSEKKLAEKQKQALQKNIKQLTEQLDKIQSELVLQQNKCKQLQRKNASIHQDYVTAQVENQKQRAQISQLQDSVLNLDKTLRQKGQKGKQFGQKITTETKALQQKIISLNSQIDLKGFMIEQNKTQINGLQKENQQLKFQLNRRKNQFVKSEDIIQKLKCNLLVKQQNEQSLISEKNSMLEEIQKFKQKVVVLEHQLVVFHATRQTLELKEIELSKNKQQLANAQKILQKTNNDLRASVVENRKELLNRNTKQEELRRVIRNLEKELQEKELDMASQKKKLLAEFDRERKQLENQLSHFQKSNHNIQAQNQYEKDQMAGQIQALNSQCLNMQAILAEKQQLLNAQSSQIRQYQRKIQDLTNQLKNCLQVWDKQKSAYLNSKKQMNELQSDMGRFQKYATQLDTRSKQLLQVSRKKIIEQPNTAITELLREVEIAVMKSKTKALGRSNTDQEKQTIMNDYKIVQEKLEQAMKFQHFK